MKTTQKPVSEILIGSLKAAIWKNTTANGPRYNVTFCRLYKDGEKWNSTDSFGRDDLLTLAKLADHAHNWIISQKEEAK